MVDVDAEVASKMGRLADLFVQGSAEEGWAFGYSITEADRLDDLADRFLRGGPEPGTLQSMAIAMGAYVGELIVRAGFGVWVLEPQTGSAAVRLRSGLTCFPLNKVHKRLTVGPEHHIAQFVAVAIDGTLPPEARLMPPPTS